MVKEATIFQQDLSYGTCTPAFVYLLSRYDKIKYKSQNTL